MEVENQKLFGEKLAPMSLSHYESDINFHGNEHEPLSEKPKLWYSR